MIDGLYLSCYFDIDPLKNVLNVQQRHDHGAALFELANGHLTLRRYWEFERISGSKQHARAVYDIATATHMLSELLAEEGELLRDVVQVWGTPGLETSTAYRRTFPEMFAFHGIAHLMTALHFRWSDAPDRPLLAMSLDGAPDTLFESDARARHYYPGCILDEELQFFPCESPGRLWQYAKTKYGMREGTLMALATASDSEVTFDAGKFDALSFMDLETRRSAPQVIDTLDAYVRDVQNRNAWLIPPSDDRLSPREQRVSAVAKLLTQVSVRIVKRNLHRVQRDFDIKFSDSRLALAGGFALNCPTNSQLLEEFDFQDIQVPPCASDSGIALGTGLAAFHPMLRAGNISFALDSPYFGQGLGDTDWELSVVSELIEDVREITSEEAAWLLVTEGVLAWVYGKSEIGPRALGHRSLLGDPRKVEVKGRLNAIKQRQWWRPVAPAVAHERGSGFFENYQFSPFMALNFRATEHAKRVVPGVLHVDDTARLQSVTPQSNAALAHLLAAFESMAGVAVLANTSLNDAGEPIINRLSEAVNFAAGKGIASLVVNANTLVRLRDTRNTYGGPATREGSRYFAHPDHVDPTDVVRKENPHSLTRKHLAHYFDNPELFRALDPRVARDADVIRRETEAYIAEFPGALADRE